MRATSLRAEVSGKGGSSGVSGGPCSLSPMERVGSGPQELKASVLEKGMEEMVENWVGP